MVARLASRYMAKPTGANQICRQEGELGNDCQVYTIRVKQAQANRQARWWVRFRAQLGNDCHVYTIRVKQAQTNWQARWWVRFRAQLGNDCKAGVQVYGEAYSRQTNMQARERVRE